MAYFLVFGVSAILVSKAQTTGEFNAAATANTVLFASMALAYGYFALTSFSSKGKKARAH